MLLALLAWTVMSGAQTTEGSVQGTVVSGGTKAAQVLFRSIETDVLTTASVRPDGSFTILLLAPGEYVISLSGLPPTAPITVLPGEILDLRFSGDGKLLTSAPLAPSPGTLAVPDQNADGLLSLGGLPATQNATLLDGVQTTQSFSGAPAGAGRSPVTDPDDDPDSAERTTGPAHGLARGRHAGVAYIFSQAAVREFRVGPGGYSAAASGVGDAVSTTVSRSGTKQFHGSAFFLLRSSAFAARNPDALATSYNAGVVTSAYVKPHDLREGFGAALGGPLAPAGRKLFFFYAYDGQRRGFPAVSSPASPNFYQLGPNQQALLSNRGVPVAAVDTALTYLSSLTGPVTRRSDQNLNFGRVDWMEHAHAGLTFEATRVRWAAPAGLVETPVVARGRASLGSAEGTLDLALVRLTTAWSARTVHQARVSFLRDVQFETAQTPLAQEPAVAAGGLAPEVDIGPNGLLFGTPAGLGQGAFPDERRVELADTLTLTRGRHTVSLGAGLSLIHDRVAALENAAGTYRYDTGSAGASGLVDFITDYAFNVNTYPNGGCPSIFVPVHLFCFQSFGQSFGPQRLAFSTQDWSGYATDAWRAGRRLTVQLGLRYDYTLLPAPVAPNAQLDALFGSRGATSVFPEDRNNLGPRLSIAWQPRPLPGTTVRVGYGLFYGRAPGATVSHALSDTALPGSTTRVRISPATVVPCNAASSQGFGYPCSLTGPPAGARTQMATAVVFARNFRLPAIQQGSLMVEHNLGHRTTLTAGYVLNIDRQLPGSTDLNIAPSSVQEVFRLQGGTGAPGVQDGETFAVPLYTARISPSFGPVTAISSRSNGSYNALVLTAAAQPAAHLNFSGEYRWSKAIDDGPDLSGIPRTDSQFDPYQMGYDKGLSSLNYPWIAQAQAVWRPRVLHRSRVLRRLGDGYTLTPVVTARAGRPYTFDLGGGTALEGGHQSLNGSGGALYLPTVGRNTLRLPATVRADLRVARGFQAGARLRLEGTAEAINLTNHRNVSSVNQRAYLRGTTVAGVTGLVFQSAAVAGSVGNTAFGTVNAASAETARERQVQFGVALVF